MGKKDKGKAKKVKIMKHKPKQKNKKTGKRRFFEVSAPMTAAKISLYASSAEELEGKTVKLDLTRSLRGRALELRMKIHSKGDKLEASPVSANLIQSYVRRMVRRGTDYVEDSYEVESRDKKLRVKTLFVTRRRVSRAVRGALRELAKKHIIASFKVRDGGEIIQDVMANKIQKELSQKLKKIYPLALCEIRRIEILGDLDKKKADKEEKKDSDK
tara:strand:- start:488 stop:1132 length:645 start_codon:yes stop_codon:yes gene_type:complete